MVGNVDWNLTDRLKFSLSGFWDTSNRYKFWIGGFDAFETLTCKTLINSLNHPDEHGLDVFALRWKHVCSARKCFWKDLVDGECERKSINTWNIILILLVQS